MRKEPAVRRDGKCARCRQPKPVANPKSQIKDLQKLINADPFCSSLCARRFHGVKLLQEESPQHARKRTEAQTSPTIVGRKVA